MIKAGSLFYAIVISLIIAIVSSSLILFSYLSHIQFETFEINQRLQLNANSGLNLLLSRQSLIETHQSKVVDLYGDGTDSVQLTRKPWGAYEVVISKAVFKGMSKVLTALVGYVEDSALVHSIYLVDQDKPLALSGKTIIKGPAFLPKAGVSRAYIEGQSFTGERLIDGVVKQSEKKLPEVSKGLITTIQSIAMEKRIADDDSVVFVEGDLNFDSLRNSFSKPSLVFVAQNTLRVSGGSYSGNIVIVSDKQINVSPDAFVSGIIILAPRIVLERGFHGSLQAFASDSVIVEKDVILSYPSVVAVIRRKQSPVVAAVSLSEGDTVSGCIFAYRPLEEIERQSGVVVPSKSFVYGQVFSNGYVDVSGTIFGSLMCSKIIFKTPSSVYENHLLNAIIDRTKLSKHFIGVSLVEGSGKKQVVKWEN